MNIFEKRFRKKNPVSLIKGYLNCNADYRRITREELTKRRQIGELNLYLRILGRKPVKRIKRVRRQIRQTGFMIPRIRW